MSSGGILLLVGFIFFLINYHWNDHIYKKKIELEKRERSLRNFWCLNERLDSILDNINDGLDEWKAVGDVHCPQELQSFKKAQEEVTELIHDVEVTGDIT